MKRARGRMPLLSSLLPSAVSLFLSYKMAPKGVMPVGGYTDLKGVFGVGKGGILKA
ncbi:MAG: hypothetical protein ACE5D4_08920 [Thermodesulfobacteriota bacterium]